MPVCGQRDSPGEPSQEPQQPDNMRLVSTSIGGAGRGTVLCVRAWGCWKAAVKIVCFSSRFGGELSETAIFDNRCANS